MKKEIVLVLWYFSNCSYFQLKKNINFFSLPLGHSIKSSVIGDIRTF